MSDPMAQFIANTSASLLDDVREEAARCAEETGKWQRSERGPLRMPTGLVGGEFSDAAFGVASEVAMTVAEAMKAARVRWRADMPWLMAAELLRAGWRRGHKLLPHIVRKGAAS